MTQERLAWDCELDKGYLSQVESGKRLPSVAVLQEIAERLGVELADVTSLDLDKPRLRLLDAARRGDRQALRQALRELPAPTVGKRAG